MADKPKLISGTARALLTAAATRDDRLIRLPRLPIAAARQVVRSLLNSGTVEEISAPIEDIAYACRTTEGDGVLMLQATDVGLARLTEHADFTTTTTPLGTAIELAAGTLGKAGGSAGGDLATPMAASAASAPISTARVVGVGRIGAS